VDARATAAEARAIQAALRTTTETLAHSLAGRSAPAAEWSDYEWRIAKATAAIHGVSALLHGLPGPQGPSDWMRFLREQRQHVLDRHGRIQELLRQIDTRARNEGLACVALKGAALHALGLYEPGERPMADVDLLVAEADAGRARRLIESFGFHRELVTWKHDVFAPGSGGVAGALGEHATDPIKIELHSGIAEAFPMNVTSITRTVWPECPTPGLNPYPSRSALMAHVLLHAAGTTVFRSLRLLHLHDIARLSQRMTQADWNELLFPADDAARWWALPPLQLTARYFRDAIPAYVLDALAADCPRLLRGHYRMQTLSDVSLSRLWVDAFPGIEWSGSAVEMVRYVGSRLRPSAETLALRRALLRSAPAGSQSQWQQLSQGRRMLRWLTSRPARDETLRVVHAALHGAG
jgi:hypothetical protein